MEESDLLLSPYTTISGNIFLLVVSTVCPIINGLTNVEQNNNINGFF